MRITEIRDAVVPIASEIRNAYISFATMTVSAVAVVTDVVRGGKPVVGYGFNSNGRYAQRGILRDRIIPRLLAADPAVLRDDARENFDPHKAWRVMLADEKPGGHGERSVAVGVLDMALWDLVAKIEGKPLYRVLADRYRDGEADTDVWVYAAGGLLLSRQRYRAARCGDAALPRSGLPHCENQNRRRYAWGGLAAH